MNDRTAITPVTLSIAAVERDTGLSKDTLRVWERRYGFPSPGRDALGERAYPLDQLEKLRLIKRLMDAGHRPGRIVALPHAVLSQLSESQAAQPDDTAAGEPGGMRAPAPQALQAELAQLLTLLRSHDVVALRGELHRTVSRLGVTRFVTEIVGPLNTAVGDAWMRGQLQIFEEHIYTEAIQVVLRQAIARIPDPAPGSRPRVLLSTFPGEPHGLGLLMAEAVCVMEGCHCLSLGVQTPLWDIVLAAKAHRADLVALSFTGCMSPNQVAEGLGELRAKLPPTVQVWAGGTAPVLHRRRIEGVLALSSLGEIASTLRRWRMEMA